MRNGRRLAVGAATALLAAAAFVRAQEEPVVIGERKRYAPFHIERPEMQLELLARYSKDTFKFGDGSESDSTNLLFEEILSGSTSGYVLSPKIFTTQLSGAFGLSQATSDSGGGSNDSNGTIYEFDVNNIIMPASRAPLTVFARRSVNLLDRPFGPTLENTDTNYGVTWNIQSESLPTVLTLQRYEVSQTSLVGEDEFSYAQNVFQWHTDWRMSKRQTLSWDYVYAALDNDAATGSTSTFDSHDATITHEILFGSAGESRLESTFNYYVEKGDFEQTRISLDEYLFFQHSDRFQTYYTYRYNSNEYEASKFDQHRGTANFRHRLFDSLRTTGTAGLGYYIQDSDATTFEQFGELRLDYTKKVPLGQLGLVLFGACNFQQNDARSDAIQVVNDPYLVDPVRPIVINRRDVDPDSLVITNSSGIRTYVRNVDYTQSNFPDRIEIRRVIGGAILPGETVLVDYQIAPEDANNRNTYTFGLSGRYAFAQGPLTGLAVYGRFLRQDQQIESSSASQFTPDDVNEYTVGADYRFWKMILSAEHRIHDSTVSPYTDTRFEAQYNDRIGLYTTLGLGASYFLTSYDSSGETALLVLHGNVDRRFSRQLFGRATMSWYQEDGTSQFDGKGWDQELELRWKHRQTEIYCIVRHSFQDTGEQESSFLIFQMGIIRKF